MSSDAIASARAHPKAHSAPAATITAREPRASFATSRNAAFMFRFASRPPARISQRDDVREQADDADEEHRAGLDGRGRNEAPRGLPRDHDADNKEHAGLQGGGQDLGARPPPRVLLVARTARQVCRDEGDDQAGRVHNHVPRVRRQRQGPGPEGAEQLRDRRRPPSPRAPTPSARPRLPPRGNDRGEWPPCRAARGVRVLVGVRHGLVNVGRGRGRASPGGCALGLGSEGLVSRHVPSLYDPGAHESGTAQHRPRMLQITRVGCLVLGLGARVDTVTDDVS